MAKKTRWRKDKESERLAGGDQSRLSRWGRGLMLAFALLLGAGGRQALAAPWAPELDRVPSYSTGGQCEIQWHGSTYDVREFQLQWAENSSFNPVTREVTLGTSSDYWRDDTLDGLEDGKVYFIRIRAIGTDGSVSEWSNVLSTTHDSKAPSLELRLRAPAPGTPPFVARLALKAADRGGIPTGLKSMRVNSTGTWSDWVPYFPHCSVYINPAQGTTRQVTVQVRDLSGNTTESTIQVTAPATEQPANLLLVDGASTASLQNGRATTPYKTIQAAVDAAPEGAEVVVAPGSYPESVRMSGRNIVLRSLDPQDPVIMRSTVLQLRNEQTQSAVTFTGKESPACRLEGFKFQKPLESSHYYEGSYISVASGGGIAGHGTRATIQHNWIYGIQTFVAEIREERLAGDPKIYKRAYLSSFGAAMSDCDGLVQNNLITDNAAGLDSGHYHSPITTDLPPVSDFDGGALYDCDGIIQHNVFWNNRTAVHDGPQTYVAPRGALSECNGVIRNNILFNQGHGVSWGEPYPAELFRSSQPSYCCLSRGISGSGNLIVANPGFVSTSYGEQNFQLHPDSPCIDAGQYVAGLKVDINGELRGFGGGHPGRGDGSGFDIGACEYQGQVTGLAMAPDQRLRAGAAISLDWAARLNTFGSAVHFELWKGGQRLGELGHAWNPEGAGRLSLKLPALAAPGWDYRLRLVSNYNPALWAEGPLFWIVGDRAAVRPEAWMNYR